MALVRHPVTGFLIRIWEPAQVAEGIWILPPPGLELAIQAVDRNREPIHQRLGVTLAIGDWQLSGLPLSWLFEARPYTDQRGVFRIQNASASSRIGVLVTPWGSPIPPGAETLFTPIPVPWSGSVEVPATFF